MKMPAMVRRYSHTVEIHGPIPCEPKEPHLKVFSSQKNKVIILRIIQVVHSFYPSMGGIEFHTYQLAKHLSKNNEVIVYTTGKERKDEHIGKIFVRRFPSINFPFFSAVNFSPELIFVLLRENGNIFHSHGFGSFMPFFTSLVAKIKNKPFIFTLHGYPQQQRWKGVLQRLYEVFIAPVFLSLASKIISVSTLIPQALAVYTKKIFYIPNGISTDFLCHSSFSTKNTISYIGRLDEEKGIDVLIKAFSKLKLNNNNLNLAIIGKDEGIKKKLEILSSQFNICTAFYQLPYEKITKAYCNSKAIVLPSKYEGFPLVWLEALACKRPIFSSRVGDYKYFFSFIFGKNTDKFLFSSEEELVKKLQMFLANQKKYEKYIENAYRKVRENYGWDLVARKTLEVYGIKK